MRFLFYLCITLKVINMSVEKLKHKNNDEINNSYMEVLPIEVQKLLNKKRSIIVRNFNNSVYKILKLINEFKNEFPSEIAFEDVNGTWVVKCVLSCYDNTNKQSLFEKFPKGWDYFPSKDVRDKLDLIETEFFNLIESYNYLLQVLQKKNKKPLNSWGININENGMIVSSRGNLCYYYIPVRGLTKHEGDAINVYNPRSKKHFTLRVVNDLEKDESLYKCVDEHNNTFYIASESVVSIAWGELFAINKELYWGWWNKILIKE